jgi:hypothetical protein
MKTKLIAACVAATMLGSVAALSQAPGQQGSPKLLFATPIVDGNKLIGLKFGDYPAITGKALADIAKAVADAPGGGGLGGLAQLSAELCTVAANMTPAGRCCYAAYAPGGRSEFKRWLNPPTNTLPRFQVGPPFPTTGDNRECIYAPQ